MEATTPKKRTITLTDRPPVRITDEDWPVIAHGSYVDHDNQYEFQANRTWRANIRVRQHANGRMIVYGVYDYDTKWQDERDFRTRAGQLLDVEEDPIAAIRRVAHTMIDVAADAGHEDCGAHISAAMRDCIANLPAVDL